MQTGSAAAGEILLHLHLRALRPRACSATWRTPGQRGVLWGTLSSSLVPVGHGAGRAAK